MAQHNFAVEARFNYACHVVHFAIGVIETIQDRQFLHALGMRLHDALCKEQDVDQVREEDVDTRHIDGVNLDEDSYLQDLSPG